MVLFEMFQLGYFNTKSWLIIYLGVILPLKNYN
jgi:hypothetical protein